MTKYLVTGLLIFIGYINIANAGVILQAANVTADSSNGSALDDHLIDQTGLSSGYTSQVTDFDSFVSSTTHGNTCGADCTVWASTSPISFPFNIDYDLGGTFAIESLALWNYGSSSLGLVDFSIYSSLDSSFTSSTFLGSFTALNPDTSSNIGQVFSFATTDSSYIRMVLNSNGGSIHQVAIGEVAFEIASSVSVPEPASLVLFALGVAGIGFSRKVKSA